MIHFARALIRTAALLPCLSVAAIAEAEEEKILNVYNWPEYIGESTVRSFEKETGIEALAPDGLVEAFSVADARGFNLCLQWHPEWQAASIQHDTAAHSLPR